MRNEYIIINKTALLKMRKELKKEYANWDGRIYNSDYQRGQMDLIDAIISSQSTALIPQIEKAYNTGTNYGIYLQGGSYDPNDNIDIEDYISKLKLDI